MKSSHRWHMREKETDIDRQTDIQTDIYIKRETDKKKGYRKTNTFCDFVIL